MGRSIVNVLTSQVVLVCGMSSGTASEVALALKAALSRCLRSELLSFAASGLEHFFKPSEGEGRNYWESSEIIGGKQTFPPGSPRERSVHRSSSRNAAPSGCNPGNESSGTCGLPAAAVVSQQPGVGYSRRRREGRHASLSSLRQHQTETHGAVRLVRVHYPFRLAAASLPLSGLSPTVLRLHLRIT
jgi:hypothetical protein